MLTKVNWTKWSSKSFRARDEWDRMSEILLTGLIPTHWKWYHSSHRSQQIMFVSSGVRQMQYNCCEDGSAVAGVGTRGALGLPELKGCVAVAAVSALAVWAISSATCCFLRSFLDAVPFEVVARVLLTGPLATDVEGWTSLPPSFLDTGSELLPFASDAGTSAAADGDLSSLAASWLLSVF